MGGRCSAEQGRSRQGTLGVARVRDRTSLLLQCYVGSPADGELMRGDVIRKIGAYDSRDLRHKDAQTLFRNAGNTIDLVVLR